MKVTSKPFRVCVASLAWATLLILTGRDRIVTTADDGAGATSEDSWTAMRKKAAHQERRIIFNNNDGDDAVYECKEATPEALLECRTTALAGTQVDTIFYCTWCSGFSYFTHRTKIGSIFTCREDKLSNNRVAEFVERGTDP